MVRIRQAIRAIVPATLRRAGRFAGAALMDVVDWTRGTRDPRVPLRCKTFVGNGDFRAVGGEILSLLVDHAGLQPSDSILDVGSGQGRLALVLADYMAPNGTYDGLEVVAAGVDWCQRVYAGDRRFQFRHADIYNEHYNPAGRSRAEEYTFPYSDSSFDFAVLSSVFTHLREGSVKRYIEELSRVVKSGGRVAATMFLLDSESRRLIKAGTAGRLFKYDSGPIAVVYRDDPDAAVAQDEAWVVDEFNRNGFDVRIRHGAWSGRADGAGSQDLLVAIHR
jgi:SAM-dependent methyltransferase